MFPLFIMQVNPKAFALPDNTDHFPVITYKKYASPRPTQYQELDSPFYKAIKSKQPKKDSDSFTLQPLGANTIGVFGQHMAAAAGIQDGPS